MNITESKKICMELALVRKSINTGNFENFEEFVKLDSYRQDLEAEIAVIGEYKAGTVVNRKSHRQ
ncbi:MAG: hypothetical protein MRK01_01675 [Candidatus Scalindua sp.]|nr:hypothetical protein [Candidatus Scalindua sp.]